jgi:hypothetical protein
MTDETIEQLERLDALRSRGALSDEEFASQKQALLGTGRDSAALAAEPEPEPEPEEPGYDNATENLALAAYIFAVVFPIVGVISASCCSRATDRERAGPSSSSRRPSSSPAPC